MSVRRMLAAAFAAPLLLAGCQQEAPEPKLPEPSAAPTTKEPVKDEKPEEFIRRWAELETEMENTGEVDDYLAISGGCESCVSLAQAIEEYYEAGGYVKWGGWDIKSIKPWGKAKNHYELKVDSAPTEYKESESGPVKTLEGGPSAQLLRIKRVGGGWRVIEKSQLSS